MFTKFFSCGRTVTVSEYVVALRESDGAIVTNSKVEYYYSDRNPYQCYSEEQVAETYHVLFCECCDLTEYRITYYSSDGACFLEETAYGTNIQQLIPFAETVGVGDFVIEEV